MEGQAPVVHDAKPSLRRWLAGHAPLVVGILAIAAILAAAAFRWRHLRDDALIQAEQRVSGLADAKKLAIESWIADRRQAAALVTEYARPGMGSAGRQWSAVQQLAGFERLWVLDSLGRVTASAGIADALGSRFAETGRRTARDGRPRIEGPVRGPDGLTILIAQPIVAPAAGGALPRSVGAVVVTLDPADVLYPQLAHQPFATASGQCYIVGREGDYVVLLSSRRHPAAEPLSQREPFAAASLLDRSAADGLRTFGAFPGNEGIPVIAAVRRVAGTDWGLVCRLDRWEAFAPLTARARSEAVAVLAVILAGILGVQWFRRRTTAALEAESRRTAEHVASTELRYRTVVEESLAGVYIISDGRFQFVNGALATAFGYTPGELAGKSALEIVATDDRAAAAANLEQRAAGRIDSRRFSFKGRRRDGTLLDIESYAVRTIIDGKPVIIGTLLDVTERRALELQLQQAQKMEAIGLLAGGMAHDFNNLLTSILAASELARQDLPEGSPAVSELVAIEHAARRGAELTRKLLAFGRRQRLEFQLVDLTWLIRDFSVVIRRVVREDIELRSDMPDAPVVVRADPGALEQIVLNLVTNARDAMPDGGTLRLAVGRTAVDDAAARAAGLSEAGGYATITVSDSGPGMDAATVARVFEPFFTTKPLGVGTGLGLAMVYGLCRQHRGQVTVTSSPGQGTQVMVMLPLVNGAAEAAAPPAPARAQAGGNEIILLVEDEASLLAIGRRVLERHGYRVLTASDGQAALELVRSRPGLEVDLLVTDVVMPRMGGPQLVDTLRREGFEPRVLFTSGYAARDIKDTGALDPALPLLNKPWTIGDLLEKVREVLATPRPPSPTGTASGAPPA
jgi:two-component system, cell cycle sensor histidine kinase and response regulator CckA